MSHTHTSAGCTNEQTHHDIIESLDNELRTVFRKPGMRQRSKQQLLKYLRDDEHPSTILQRILQRSENQYLACEAEMPDVKYMDIIRDDKSNYHAWMMHSDATQCANEVCVAHNPRWKMLCMTHWGAHRAILERMKTTLSERLWRVLKLWMRPMMPPQLYITVKPKCSHSGIGKIGRKEGHSCCRKNCSFWVWVQKLEWRWLSSGIETYIKHATPTWKAFK